VQGSGHISTVLLPARAVKLNCRMFRFDRFDPMTQFDLSNSIAECVDMTPMGQIRLAGWAGGKLSIIFKKKSWQRLEGGSID
jgi:hypothetical protein